LNVIGRYAGDLVDDLGKIRADFLGGGHEANSFIGGWDGCRCRLRAG
jgi:hypothetical protein